MKSNGKHPHCPKQKGARARRRPQYVLRLYISGATARSARAILNLESICREHLHGRYELEVIDVYQQPHLAKTEQIIAAPTLIKHLPAPLRRFIGDMSQTERILVGLGLQIRRDEDRNDYEVSPPRF